MRLVKHFFIIFFFALTAQSIHATHQEPPKLVVSAQATIHKPSDELQIKVGVISLDDTAEATLNENNAKMQKVIDNLASIGLTKSDYETGQFSIQPTYTPYPKNPPASWKPSISGYKVSNSIMIHTDKLDMAGKIIDVAQKAGANSITDIRFSLHDPRSYWTEALTAAAANAIDDAKAIASATEVKLVRVLSITLDNTHVNAHKVNTAYLATARTESNTPPIEPGEVKLTANITLTYEIQ